MASTHQQKPRTAMPLVVFALLLLALAPAAHALAWSEIMYNPTGADYGLEYLEFIGTEDLTGCAVRDTASADTLELLQPSEGSDVILIVESDSPLVNMTTDAAVYGAGAAIGNGLANTAETLEISCAGTALLTTSYNNSEITGIKEGYAIMWRDAWVLGAQNGTPGVSDALPAPDPIPDPTPTPEPTPTPDPTPIPDPTPLPEPTPVPEPTPTPTPVPTPIPVVNSTNTTLPPVTNTTGNHTGNTTRPRTNTTPPPQSNRPVIPPGLLVKEEICNATLIITVSANEGYPGDTVRFTVTSPEDASWEAMTNEGLLAYGDTRERRTHAIALPDAGEVRLIASSRACGGRQRSTRSIIVRERPATPPVATVPSIPAEPPRQTVTSTVHQALEATQDGARPTLDTDARAIPAVTGAVVADTEVHAIPWIAGFGIVTLAVSAWVYQHTVKTEKDERKEKGEEMRTGGREASTMRTEPHR